MCNDMDIEQCSEFAYGGHNRNEGTYDYDQASIDTDMHTDIKYSSVPKREDCNHYLSGHSWIPTNSTVVTVPSIETPPDDRDEADFDPTYITSTLFLDFSDDLPEFSEDTSSNLPSNVVANEHNRSDLPSPALSTRSNDNSSMQTDEEPDGAFRRCEARIRRLDKLNAALEAFGRDDWSCTDNRHLLERRLNQNPYCAAIKARMLAARLHGVRVRPELLRDTGQSEPDLGLSGRARSCSAAVADELTSLRMVQHQTVAAVGAMLRSASADVPLCSEEAGAAMARARAAYAPAKLALRSAVDALERRQPPPASAAAAAAAAAAAGGRRKGQLCEEAKRVLEDWTVKHFDHPYPSNEEKQARPPHTPHTPALGWVRGG
jgi:hypothetical protein